jgi:hypothetical protein
MKDAGGLMKIRVPPPPIRSEFLALSGHVPPGTTIELLPSTFFKFAVFAFQGNGDPGARIDIEVGPFPGAVEYVETVFGNWVITKVYANRAVRLKAIGDPYSTLFYGTIYIIYLDW